MSVEIPKRIKEELVRVQSVLKNELTNKSIRWEKPEKMHLTLLFIGEVEKERIMKLEEVVTAQIKKVEPFKLGLKGISTFPNTQRPRVIMVNIEDINGSYTKLQKNIVRNLEKFGFSCASPKPPHFTLARVREGSVELPEVRFKNDLQFTVESIAIKESFLHPTGAEHKTISIGDLGS